MHSEHDLVRLISYIEHCYMDSCSKWESLVHPRYNLKKHRISEIRPGGEIYSNISAYLSFLTDISHDFYLNMPALQDSRVFARVKASNSIAFKIRRYQSEKRHEYGRVPIHKCLNDLFGIRIILDQPLSLYDVRSILNELSPKLNRRCMDSSKFGYKAIHLYFFVNNYVFQWELQIWCKENESSNLESHKEHKQDYTSWEYEANEMKEGGILI